MKLYVGNLSYKLTEEDLHQVFKDFGTVNSVKIMTDRDTGRPKGFGFVEMENQGEAEAAIKELNGKTIDSRALTVNEARPKAPNPKFGNSNNKRW